MSSADQQPPIRTYMALPGRTRTNAFHRCVANLLNLIGTGAPPAGTDAHEWESSARALIRSDVNDREQLPEAFFDALLRAGVHDPNPSFNRQFIAPALTAFGRRRVQTALLLQR